MYVNWWIDGMKWVVGVVGIVKWEIQELSSQGTGEHIQREKVIGLLCVSKRGQSGETPKVSNIKKWGKKVPGFYMVEFAWIHPETL